MSEPVHSMQTETRREAAKAIRSVAGSKSLAGASSEAPAMVLSDPRLPGVEITLEYITAQLAELYLGRLPKRQRKQSEKTVDRYTGDMIGSQWLFVGDAIRFNDAGELVDGQHRLRAITECGVPQMMLVVRGVDPEAIQVIDTGRPRRFTDVLRMEGIASPTGVNALTKRVFDWQRGNFAVPGIGRIPNPPFLNVPASASKLSVTFDERREKIQAAARRGSWLSRGFANKTAPGSVLAFAYLLFGEYDLDMREDFFFQLEKGPSQNGHEYPPYVLRERLKKKVPMGHSGLPDWVWLHFLFQTWNRWWQGRSIGPLKTPSRAVFSHIELPQDPHADTRNPGWEPLQPGVREPS